METVRGFLQAAKVRIEREARRRKKVEIEVEFYVAVVLEQHPRRSLFLVHHRATFEIELSRNEWVYVWRD